MHSISKSIISCRNTLIDGRFHDEIPRCLEDVLNNLDLISIESSRKIVEYCVFEAIAQINNSELISAGWILNLIHNIPLDDVSDERWDIDYFLSMELSSFLENYEVIKSSRKIVLFISSQLFSRYVGTPTRDVFDKQFDTMLSIHDTDETPSNELLKNDDNFLCGEIDTVNQDIYLKFSSRQALSDFARSLLQEAVYGTGGQKEFFPLISDGKALVVEGARLTEDSSRIFITYREKN